MWLSLSTKTLVLDREKIICSALLDVTEAHELSSQLSYQATYDELTGLVNRREFEERLQETIDLAQEEKTENVLCYLDLDQFKVINDTCGHMAGDEMCASVSAGPAIVAFAEMIPWRDLVGDEVWHIAGKLPAKECHCYRRQH